MTPEQSLFITTRTEVSKYQIYHHEILRMKTGKMFWLAGLAISPCLMMFFCHFQEQTPFIFNIGLYVLLAVCCLACPLKTYIKKKTKLIPLKVSKIYFFDPYKEQERAGESLCRHSRDSKHLQDATRCSLSIHESCYSDCLLNIETFKYLMYSLRTENVHIL